MCAMDKPDHINERETANTATSFERELQQAMRHINAPGSLEVFLMNAAEAEEHRRQSKRSIARHGGILAFPRPRSWFGGAIAALLVLGCFSVEGLHIRHEREEARARQAEQQFEEAQQITDRALAQARARIERAGVSLDGE
jgi:hypothetical protein